MSNKIGFVETPLEIADLMVKMASVSAKSAVVLDTGFGRGIFLDALYKNKFKYVSGIEISDEFYWLCYSRYGKSYNLIKDDFLRYQFTQKFDLIIGNPPYVHFNSLPNNISNSVKKYVGTSESDIYYAFIMKSINLLKDNGELIYIVPYHFFYNTHARTLREFLLRNGYFEIIIDLDESKIFKNESPETIIFKYVKNKRPIKDKKIEILKVKDKKYDSFDISKYALSSLCRKSSNEIFEYYYIDQFTTSDLWNTNLSDIPDFPSLKLGHISKVGVGLVSGSEAVFSINKEFYSILTEEEKRLIKKFIKAKHCKRYITEEYSLYFIIDDLSISEDTLKDKYPNFYNKIFPLKKHLSNRYLQNNHKWFHWQALRNYTFLNQNQLNPKIYVPVMDRASLFRFGLSFDDFLPSGDVIFIQPYNKDDAFFILGYLNSDFFRKYYISKGARRGGRICFTQRILENVLIPMFETEIKQKISYLTRDIWQKTLSKISIDKEEKELNNTIFTALNEKLFMQNISYINSNEKISLFSNL